MPVLLEAGVAVITVRLAGGRRREDNKSRANNSDEAATVVLRRERVTASPGHRCKVTDARAALRHIPSSVSLQ
jgi:hypothetical protein